MTALGTSSLCSVGPKTGRPTQPIKASLGTGRRLDPPQVASIAAHPYHVSRLTTSMPRRGRIPVSYSITCSARPGTARAKRRVCPTLPTSFNSATYRPARPVPSRPARPLPSHPAPCRPVPLRLLLSRAVSYLLVYTFSCLHWTLDSGQWTVDSGEWTVDGSVPW